MLAIESNARVDKDPQELSRLALSLWELSQDVSKMLSGLPQTTGRDPDVCLSFEAASQAWSAVLS